MLQCTFDILTLRQQRGGEEPALVDKINNGWKRYTVNDCWKRVKLLVAFLQQIDVKPGDRVIMMPELATADWICLDLAVQSLGAITVMAHSGSQESQFDYILTESEARVCFFKGEEEVVKYFPNGHGSAAVIHLYGKGETSLNRHLEDVEEVESEGSGQQIDPEALSTIIYTSGTTGIPKGVMLSHQNIMSNVTAIVPLIPLDAKANVMSFLPYSHAFERTLIYSYLALGVTIYLPGEIAEVRPSFKVIRPDFFSAVPRIIEKMYAQVAETRSKQGWLGKNLLNWALSLGLSYGRRSRLDFPFWFKVFVSRKLIFRRFRKELGGKLKGIVVGGAHLNPKLAQMFAAAGVPIREGYGLTETSPVVTVNRFNPGMYKFESVGLPLPGVQVRIDNPNEVGEGEIMVKGPNVMLGYYENKDATDEVLTADRWLHTGDIGYLKERFLYISDRKKDIFKTSTGKYIAPQFVENHYKKSDYIDQLLVVGFQRPFLTALIYPAFEMLEIWAVEEDIHWTSAQYMALNIKVIAKIEEEIESLNDGLSNHEKVRGFILLHEEWTLDSGLLSNTLKPKRSLVIERYQKEIDKLYKEKIAGK